MANPETPDQDIGRFEAATVVASSQKSHKTAEFEVASEVKVFSTTPI